VRVLGGATWLDAELAVTQDGADEGNRPIGTPDWQANLNVEWEVPRVAGLTLDAGATYTDAQYVNSANTWSIPSWTRFDLGARWEHAVAGIPFALRARIENVTDESDWVSAGGYPGANYLVLGAPRTFVLSASVDF
jgi:iron complex outermembrane recepter protein